MLLWNWPYFLYVALPIMVLGFIASSWVKQTYQRYSQVRNASGLAGVDVARRILAGAGLSDVTGQVIHGELSDNYDPRSETLNLSRAVAAELDASRGALLLLAENGVIVPEEQEGARRMLRAAAFPSWVPLSGAVLTLLYYASLVFGTRRSD